MQRLRSLAAVALAIGLLAAAAPAHAQSTATLQGTVTDPQGSVMPGVSITVHNTATNQERNVVTDAAGAYVTAALAPGHYDITAHIEGFQDQKREIDLGPAQTVAPGRVLFQAKTRRPRQCYAPILPLCASQLARIQSHPLVPPPLPLQFDHAQHREKQLLRRNRPARP